MAVVAVGGHPGEEIVDERQTAIANLGNVLGIGGICTSCEQMSVGSDFLDDLRCGRPDRRLGEVHQPFHPVQLLGLGNAEPITTRLRVHG